MAGWSKPALVAAVLVAAPAQAQQVEEALGPPPSTDMRGTLNGSQVAEQYVRCARWENKLTTLQALKCAQWAFLLHNTIRLVAPGQKQRVIDPLAFAFDVLEKHDPDGQDLPEITVQLVATLVAYNEFDAANFYFGKLRDNMKRRGQPNDPRVFRAYFLMCGIPLRKEDYAEAEECTEGGIAFLRANAAAMPAGTADEIAMSAIQNLVLLKTKLGKSGEALELLDALRQGAASGAKAPFSAPFYWALLEAKAHLQKVDIVAASAALESAETFDWKNRTPEPYLMAAFQSTRGIIRTAQARFSEGEDAFRSAVAIYETLPENFAADRYAVYISFADLLDQRGRFEEARDMASKAYALRAEPLALQVLASALLSLGEYERASGLIRKAITELPDDRPLGQLQLYLLTIDLAMSEFIRGRMDGAAEILAEIRRPDSAPPVLVGNELLLQGMLADRRGESTAAIRLGREGLGLIKAALPDNHPELIWAQVMQARIEAGLSGAEARSLLREAAQAVRTRMSSFTTFSSDDRFELQQYAPLFVDQIHVAWALS